MQLGQRERLHQIVVGAAVESLDAVANGLARGQHQDRRPHAALAQAPAGLEAGEAGQHDVEHDRVVLDGLGHPQRLLAAGGDVRREPLFPDRSG